MKINWKVRLQSGPFWAGTMGALLTFLYAVCNLLGISPPVDQSTMLGVAMLFLTLLNTIGIVSDPTTPGLTDSERALQYDAPGHTQQ